MKKRASLVVGAAMVSTVLFSGSVWAQGAPQTVSIQRVDVQKLAAGYRSRRSSAAPSSTTPTRRSATSRMAPVCVLRAASGVHAPVRPQPRWVCSYQLRLGRPRWACLGCSSGRALSGPHITDGQFGSAKGSPTLIKVHYALVIVDIKHLARRLGASSGTSVKSNE